MQNFLVRTKQRPLWLGITYQHRHAHKQTQSCHNTRKVIEFVIKQNSRTEKRVTATEGALSFHSVKHRLSCRYMYCTSKLNQIIYSDSEISKKVTYVRTKTVIVNNALAPHSVSMAIQDLHEISCLCVSTDGSNHSSLKLFPGCDTIFS